MNILDKLSDKRNNRRVASPNKDQLQVAIVDEMAEVQSLDKPEWIKNYAQLAHYFSNRVLETYTGSNVREQAVCYGKRATPSYD